MKKYLLTSLFAICATSAASAAEFNPYATIRAGYDITTNISSTSGNADQGGFLLGIAGGAEFYSDADFGARLEIGYDYMSVSNIDNDNLDLSTHTLLLNLYGDIKTGTALTPYITAGVGYGWTNVSADMGYISINLNDSGLAWQIGAGISYGITDNFAIDLGYRYLASPQFDMTKDNANTNIKFDMYSHQLYLGARYAF